MSVAVISGAGGLIGAEAARFFAGQGLAIVGIDNDTRGRLFGSEASTRWAWTRLQKTLPAYVHADVDIRDSDAINHIFECYAGDIAVVLHAAGQPSHDWAARDPVTDFNINANGTLTLLEATRRHCADAVFIFCSTNKVYGDTPNRLPLIEMETRWDLPLAHPFGEHGISEAMSIDGTMHSLLGVSKAAADLLVQEYGRYFGMRTGCFRCGCLTGPGHSGTELHGFLSFLVKCAVNCQPYTVFGYRGKQVRDNLHATDLIRAFWQFFQNPRPGEVYNMGGGRLTSCSVLEAIQRTEQLTGRPLNWSYNDKHRAGDHLWWISDFRRFQSHYPAWTASYDLGDLLAEMQVAAFESHQPA